MEHLADAPGISAPSELAIAAAAAVSRNTGIVVGNDALGNVFVTGDGNTVEVKLTVVTADPRLRAPAGPVGENPYRGLYAFGETDSELFFGRDELKARLRLRLHALVRIQDAPRLLPILGPSGSGKSSLVRAGLLPALVRQPIDGLRNPSVLILRPGANPVAELERVMARFIATHGRPSAKLGPVTAGFVHGVACTAGDADTRLVIFVDQLEELFTECESEAARATFLATLAYAAAQPDRRVCVIFTMRNDFAGALRASDDFAAAVRDPFRVSQMAKEQLIEAIARPADVLGHPWPPALVENLVLQCDGRVGALPLLQYALQHLWPAHVAGRLMESQWSSRLIEDFVVQRADALYEQSGTAAKRAAHQRVIRRAFVAMIRLGEGTADTRRVAPLSEIVARGETPADVRAVLAPFASSEARLITVSEASGESTYELAHEALIGSWDRLRTWLGHVANPAEAEAVRGELRLRRRIQHAADVWRGDRSALIQPPELERARALRKRAPDELSIREHAVIDASVRAWEAHDRWRRRVRVASVIMLGLLAVLGVVAWSQKRRAEASARKAARELKQSYAEQGRDLVLEKHYQEAVPYLLLARQDEHDDLALRTLFFTAQRHLPRTLLHGHQGRVTSAAFSPDGTRIVTASYDRTARIWDAETGAPLGLAFEHLAAVNTAAFNADGTRVVTASDDQTARVWNAVTGAPATVSLMHPGKVKAAVFSPDGTRVITTSEDATARVWDARTGIQVTVLGAQPAAQVLSVRMGPDGVRVVAASEDQTARVWDESTARPITAPFAHRVTSAAFSPDGARVVTASADQTASVWDASTGKLIIGPIASVDDVTKVVFDRNGHRMVVVGNDETMHLWDMATGEPIPPPIVQAKVLRAGFNADGSHVVVTLDDHSAQVWDVATGVLISNSFLHQGEVLCAAFSPDGTRVVTASYDRMARVWDALIGDPRRIDLRLPRGTIVGATLSPNRRRVITTSDARIAWIWDTASGKLISGPIPHRGDVMRAMFSHDGARVVTAIDDHTVQVWDAVTGKSVTGLLVHPGGGLHAVFSSDGARVITVSKDKAARIWDAMTGQQVNVLVHPAQVLDAAFSADGARVATTCADNETRVWDAAMGMPITQFGGSVPAAHMAFSADGAHVVTASDDLVTVWDATTGARIRQFAHQGAVESVAFNTFGTRVVTASDDETAGVWYASKNEAAISPLAHHEVVRSAVFNADGSRVLTTSKDRTVRVWDVLTGKPMTRPLPHAQDVLDAAFSADEMQVLTVTADGVRVWDVHPDNGTPDDWAAVAKRSPFYLEHGKLVLHSDVRSSSAR